MKRTFIASIVLTVSLQGMSGGPAWAVTQCTCPKIAASGVGDTSCSASEADNKCTVDFNVFFERENRAVDLLSKAGVPQIRMPDPTISANVVLQQYRSDPDRLVDAILIYLFVGLSAQPNAAEHRSAIQ